MAERTCTLGVDLGTTTLKVIAYTDNYQVVAQQSAATTVIRDEPGASEEDPQQIADLTSELIATVARQVISQGYVVAGVGISAAMHSIIAVSHDGTPLTRALSWMDTRANEDAEALWQSDIGKQIYARTGTPIHAMSPLAKLLWLRRVHPDIFTAAQRFVSLKEWLWHSWFGVWEIDFSLASATGLLDVPTLQWNASALAVAGIRPEQLSQLVPVTHTRQQMQDSRILAAGITPDVKWTIGGSDGVLANLGAGALSPDQMVITIGTSSAVRVGNPTYMTDPVRRPFCYVLTPEHYVIGGPSNAGGIVLDWAYHQLMGGATGSFATIDAMFVAASTVSSDGIICLPYIAGERSPWWNADASATITGLRLHHTSAQLARAVIEGVLFNAALIAQGIIEQMGQPKILIASAKGLSEVWMQQLTADIFNVPVQYQAVGDVSVVGAVMVAQLAAGTISWDALPQLQAAANVPTLYPQNSQQYQSQLKRFTELAEYMMR